MLGFFERFDDQGAGNGWESSQKVFQRVLALKVLEHRLNGYSSPLKHWYAVHRLRISCDGARHGSIVSQLGWTLHAHVLARQDVCASSDSDFVTSRQSRCYCKGCEAFKRMGASEDTESRLRSFDEATERDRRRLVKGVGQ